MRGGEKKDIKLHVKLLLFLPRLETFRLVLVQPSNTKLSQIRSGSHNSLNVDSQYRWDMTDFMYRTVLCKRTNTAESFVHYQYSETNVMHFYLVY
jgi:hypothetical protein